MSFRVERVDQKKAEEIRSRLSGTGIYGIGEIILIDDERNILFACTGGQGYLPRGRGDCSTNYWMVFEGLPIFFDGYDTIETVGEVNAAIVELDNLLVPSSFVERSDKVKELITEAFAVYWDHMYSTNLAVSISFPSVGVVGGSAAP